MGRKKTSFQPTDGARGGSEESVAGYFRRLFDENPKWLKKSSNREILERWLADHPGEREVPQRVKYSLSNIKSVLRSKRRRRKAAAEPTPEAVEVVVETGPSALELLEMGIDDCLGQAKQLDRDGLADVINHLRRARNAVVWMIGQ
jgi:hypothetical protein